MYCFTSTKVQTLIPSQLSTWAPAAAVEEHLGLLLSTMCGGGRFPATAVASVAQWPGVIRSQVCAIASEQTHAMPSGLGRAMAYFGSS